MAPSDLSAFLNGDDAAADAAGAPDGSATGAAALPAAGDSIKLNDRFELFPDRPLNEFSSITATAFAAIELRGREDLVGLVCQTGLPPRWDILGSMRGIDNPSLLRIHDFGVVDWRPDNARRPVVVTGRPHGQPLVRSIKQRRDPFAEDDLQRRFIPPLALALNELKTRRGFHGQVNPTNVFLNDTEGPTSKAQLGECVTAPVGFAQPLLFETIDRGMTMPIGRGNGTLADDLYALGVTIVFLALGELPLAQLDDKAVLAAKLERGSFAAVTGDAKLPPSLTELLRGLLCDEADGRWTLADIGMWIDGRRMTPKQSVAPKRAARPFELADEVCWNARTVAQALAKHPDQGYLAIDNGSLVHWLRRSLEDEAMANRSEEAVQSARAGRAGSLEDRILSRTLMALDPQAPIRYRGRSVLPFGIGNALADAVIRGSGAQELAELIMAQLPLFWVNVQSGIRPEFASLTGYLDNARGFLERPTFGNGLERCLYELNPNMHCHSPAIEPHYVLELEGLMHALEAVAGERNRPRDPVDRHVAAFILSRRNRVKEKLVTAVSGEDGKTDRGMACLLLMAALQRETKVNKLPKLSAWMVDLLGPSLDTFHSGTLRGRVRKHLEKEAKSGVLQRLVDVVDNVNLRQRDNTGFRLASREHALTQRAIQAHERELENRDALTKDIGRQVAALAGGLIATAAIVAIVLVQAM